MLRARFCADVLFGKGDFVMMRKLVLLVLAVVVGNATRLSSYIMNMPKTYEAVVCLGTQTDTLDSTGTIVEQKDPGPYRPFAILDAVESQKGLIEQMPPVFSALKVQGQRAYKLARQGEEVSLEPRQVMVYGIDLIAIRWPLVSLRIRCGSGTYIRSIARDIGAAMNIPASLQTLRRTSVGPYQADARDTLRIDRGMTLHPETIPSLVQPIRSVIDDLQLPQVNLDLKDAYLIATGRTVQRAEWSESPPGTEVVAMLNEAPSPFLEVLAVTEVQVGGWLKPRAVFSATREWVEEQYNALNTEAQPSS
ncbi:MAG TPA: tRNA pseudouridine(55) synthase TruB [Methylococcaceae bacterium]|nr:tRNA pseudouridine(55) synthase TruB [Methylococcaceae bacterium]